MLKKLRLRHMTITCLLTRHPARARFARGRPPDKPISAGPPDTPAIDRQCLFPSKYPDTSYEAGLNEPSLAGGPLSRETLPSAIQER